MKGRKQVPDLQGKQERKAGPLVAPLGSSRARNLGAGVAGVVSAWQAVLRGQESLDVASFSPDRGYVAGLSGAWNWVKCHGCPQLPAERLGPGSAAQRCRQLTRHARAGDRLAAGRAAAPPHAASADMRGPKALEEPRASNATEQPQSQYCPDTAFCLFQSSLIPCPFQK